MSEKVLGTVLIISSILFAINFALSSLSGSGVLKGILFKNTVAELSDRNGTLITPIGWTFAIWSLIYITISATVIYVLYDTFRTPKGRDASPVVFSWATATAFLLNQAFYISWLFVWDNENLTAAAVILGAIFLSNLATLTLLSRSLFQATDYLISTSATTLWTYRTLVQNSLGMYTAWTTLATILNIAIACVHDYGFRDQPASLLHLGILFAVILLGSGVDIFYFDRFSRYVITPYLTFLWGLTGIAARLMQLPTDDFKNHSVVLYFVIGLLVATAAITTVKVIRMVYKHVKTPSPIPK